MRKGEVDEVSTRNEHAMTVTDAAIALLNKLDVGNAERILFDSEVKIETEIEALRHALWTELNPRNQADGFHE